MSASKYEDLEPHVGHKVVCVGYGPLAQPPWANVAVECEDCGVVLLDFDSEEGEPIR